MSIGETILDLILNEEDSAANTALASGHPAAFLDTCRAVLARALTANSATSISSVTIGTGTRTFTLDSARGFPSGTPVYIMETGSPSSNFMVGALSADETDLGVITVNVTSTSGSGTFTSWIILALFATATVVSPPVAIADGGTGATAKDVAKQNLEAATLLEVLSVIQSEDPSLLSPTTGDRYLSINCIGDWLGHDDEVAEWDGSAWVFYTADAGALLYAADTGDLLAFGIASANSLDAGASAWRYVNVPRLLEAVNLAGGGSVTSSQAAGRRVVVVNSSGATVTLPPVTVPGYEIVIVNTHPSGTITINVASAGTINGASSITQAGASAKAYFSVVQSGGSRWFTAP